MENLVAIFIVACISQMYYELRKLMATPSIIPQLVERFDQQRQVYRAGRYNETQLRREFLDPFFEALGLGHDKSGWAC